MLSSRQENENVDCANRALALQAEHLPFEFLRRQLREYESDVACNVRSAGKRDQSIAKPRNGDPSVGEIEPENPMGTRVSAPMVQVSENRPTG